MSHQGTLLVVSGFSGAGKGTVVGAIMDTYDDYALSISATTRKPRTGEVDGVSYFFKTTEEFKSMIEGGELLEYANYVGNYYGTPRRYVEDKLKEGCNVILEIESVGAFNVKKMFPEAVLTFIIPPSADELESRLRGRGTEEESVIAARLAKASKEAEGVEHYDYIVVNENVSDCVAEINSIAHRVPDVLDRCQVSRNIDKVNNIKKELEKFSKGE
jgi:guanylate kinase